MNQEAEKQIKQQDEKHQWSPPRLIELSAPSTAAKASVLSLESAFDSNIGPS